MRDPSPNAVLLPFPYPSRDSQAKPKPSYLDCQAQAQSRSRPHYRSKADTPQIHIHIYTRIRPNPPHPLRNLRPSEKHLRNPPPSRISPRPIHPLYIMLPDQIRPKQQIHAHSHRRNPPIRTISKSGRKLGRGYQNPDPFRRFTCSLRGPDCARTR